MNWSFRIDPISRTPAISATLAACCLLASLTSNLNAEIMVSRPPSFQVVSDLSLENEILDRLMNAGEYQPTDLLVLSRLVYLESIAMLVDIRTDLAQTSIGNRLDMDIFNLVNASEQFYRYANARPASEAEFALTRQLHEDLLRTYAQVESSLGAFPGISNLGAAHFVRVTRLLNALGLVMRWIDARLPAPVSESPARSIALEALHRNTRLLTIDLVELIVLVAKNRERPVGHTGLRNDLEGLLADVQRFEHTLTLTPSSVDVKTSLQAMRRTFWRMEAKINPLEFPTVLTGQWRSVRDRMNRIADDFGMPRVLILGKAASASIQPGTATAERRVARIHRGSIGAR
jgi:hypothetical protein